MIENKFWKIIRKKFEIKNKMLLYKPKKNQTGKGNRILISITVLGSAGPIRFVVNEEELVADVIDTAMKAYAREGRLPVLGSDFSNFVLYCPSAGTEGNSHYIIMYRNIIDVVLLPFFYKLYIYG